MILQILGLVAPILEKVIPDPEKRIEAERELQKTLLENQASLNQAMADVMKADAQSEGFLTRNARPVTVIWSVAMVTYVGVIAPLFGIQKETIDALQAVPSDLWSLMTVGIGAYMLGKSGEGIARTVAGKGRP